MAFPTSSFRAATLRRRWRRCSSFLRAAGIAQQVTLYFPFPWMAALTAYALCPAGLVLLAAARTLGGRVRRGAKGNVLVCFWAALSACARPARPLLRLLPPWITPARWSDFSYWGGLLPAVGKSHKTGFSLNPCAKDVLAKWNTLGLLIAATLANAAAGKLMLSRQQKKLHKFMKPIHLILRIIFVR